MKENNNIKLYKSYYNSPLGCLTLISDGIYLTELLLPSLKKISNTDIEENDTLEIFIKIKSWLNSYFKGEKMTIENLPLKLVGTDFQKLVISRIMKIPYKELVTYKDIAKYISEQTGKNPCPQAVGGAIGHNKIPIIIPCHRVVGTNKNLTGYTGGIDIKIKLLELEGINTLEYKMPKMRGAK